VAQKERCPIELEEEAVFEIDFEGRVDFHS